MKKKWYVMLVSTLVLVLVLAGCGKDSEEGAAKAKKDEVVTLKFNHWYTEEAGNWDEVIAAFEKEHPNIKIESEPLVDNLSFKDYLKQLDLRASASEDLDVVMFSNPYDYATRVEAGLLAPLDPYIEKEGIKIEEEYNGLFSQGQIDGSYYGLPGKKNTYLVAINKKHLDEAGLPVPTDWTWDDYQDYANKLTKGEGNTKRYGSYLHTFTDFHFFLKVLSKPQENFILLEDGSSNMADPLIKESLQLRYDMEVADKSSVPLANTLSQKLDYRQQFFTQSASMIPMTSVMITEWGEYVPEFEIAWAPWPKNNKEDEFKSYNAGDVIGIAERSENKEEAYTFIRWMSTEGMLIQKRAIPSYSNANLEEVVNTLVENSPKPEAIDKESLMYVLNTAQDTDLFIPKPYVQDAYTAFRAEAELYLLGKQDLDKSIDNITKQVKEIVDKKNKK
jgi:multiple sugar transport system substrate-binding protein